jgi:hypothetical protein
MAKGQGFFYGIVASVTTSLTIAVFLATLTLYTSFSYDCPYWFNGDSCDPPSTKSDDIKFDKNISVIKFWLSWIILIPIITAIISSIGYSRA